MLYVCVKIWHLFNICNRKYKFEINFCELINDYLLIDDPHIFVYGCAECASVSLKCTKVKLLILNNFALHPTTCPILYERSSTKVILVNPIPRCLWANLFHVRGGGKFPPPSNFVVFKDRYLKFGDNVNLWILNQSYFGHHKQPIIHNISVL